MAHPLHKIIGKIIDENLSPGYDLLKDRACDGNQNIPLFFSKEKSKQTGYCNIDLLILKDDKIKVIFEIEEANKKPTQVCGKFLTSGLSSYYIHESKENIPIGMDDSVLFIQILDTSTIKKEKTAKIEQWRNIEKSIQNIIPLKNSKIDNYKLIFGDISEFKNNREKRNELIDCVMEFLK